MTRQNPELSFIFSNPEMLRATLTPENIRAAMNMAQTMRGAGIDPFYGMGAMGGMGMPQPNPTGTAPAAGGTAPTTNTTSASSAPSSSTTAPNTSTAPPGARQNPFVNLAQMFSAWGGPYAGMGVPPAGATGTTAAAPTAPAAPSVDPKVKYATQLSQMKDMGFINEDVNLEELQAANGNIQIAIERLLSKLPQ